MFGVDQPRTLRFFFCIIFQALTLRSGKARQRDLDGDDMRCPSIGETLILLPSSRQGTLAQAAWHSCYRIIDKTNHLALGLVLWSFFLFRSLLFNFPLILFLLSGRPLLPDTARCLHPPPLAPSLPWVHSPIPQTRSPSFHLKRNTMPLF